MYRQADYMYVPSGGLYVPYRQADYMYRQAGYTYRQADVVIMGQPVYHQSTSDTRVRLPVTSVYHPGMKPRAIRSRPVWPSRGTFMSVCSVGGCM